MIDRLLDDLHEWLNGREPGQVSRSMRGTEIQLLVDEIEELRRMASSNCVDAIRRCVDETRQAKVDVVEDVPARRQKRVASKPAKKVAKKAAKRAVKKASKKKSRK